MTDNGAGLPELAGAGVSHHGAVTGYGAGNLFGAGAMVLDARPAGSARSWIRTDDDFPDDGIGAGPGGTGNALGGVGRAFGGGGHGIIGMRERRFLAGR